MTGPSGLPPERSEVILCARVVVPSDCPGAWWKETGAQGCRGARRALFTMGLADQLFRRECSQFCGGAGPDPCYFATGAAAKAGCSRAGLASRCLGGFAAAERSATEQWPSERFVGGCAVEWSGARTKAGKSAVLAHATLGKGRDFHGALARPSEVLADSHQATAE